MLTISIFQTPRRNLLCRSTITWLAERSPVVLDSHTSKQVPTRAFRDPLWGAHDSGLVSFHRCYEVAVKS